MKKIEVGKSIEISESKLHPVEINGEVILLTRIKEKVYAISNKCPHLGFSMSRGKISEGAVQCPWHGSRFDICTGENLDWVNAFAGIEMPKWSHRLIALGKDPAPLKTFEASEENGIVYVTLDRSE